MEPVKWAYYVNIKTFLKTGEHVSIETFIVGKSYDEIADHIEKTYGRSLLGFSICAYDNEFLPLNGDITAYLEDARKVFE